jgi:hypothetical protein
MFERIAMAGVVAGLALGLTACGPTKPAYPGDSKNCSDFSSQAAAQARFNTYYPWYGDVARLDADNDKIACESL